MSDELETLKAELECFGQEHDAATSARNRRMFDITRDTKAMPDPARRCGEYAMC